MKVSRIMSQKVITVPPTAGLEQAMALMKEHDIRHLPVVEGDKLIGLVTEGEVRGALFPAMLEEISIKDLMVANPITVTPDTLIEDAARLVYVHKIGCLPVVDHEGSLKGIVTVADMLRALIELMGFLSATSRLDVILPDKAGALEEAVRIIGRHGGRIIGVSLTGLKNNHRPIHLFRLQKTDLEPIARGMVKAGFSVVASLS
ncbi:MAG: CBS domain-containing protein [Pseudomonadota bacterium]